MTNLSSSTVPLPRPDQRSVSFLVTRSISALPEITSSLAEESWENEGGLQHFALPRSQGARKFEKLSNEIDRLTHALSSDFANGRIGQRHNTFEHRSRVLRQLTARRDAMREQMGIS